MGDAAFNRQMSELAKLGERNAEIITLLENHCSHAHVVLSPWMGRGMAEELLGLPVNGREIECPHAPNTSSASMNLESVAVDFYRRNCAGCTRRDPVRLPISRRSWKGSTRSERRQTLLWPSNAWRRMSAEHPVHATAKHGQLREPQPTRDFIALLDGIDIEVPDDRADRLVDLARAAPEICSPIAATLLIETAENAATEQLFEAIGHLRRAGRVEDRAALDVAVTALAKHGAYEAAARIVVDLREDVEASMLRPAIPSLIALAGPIDGIGERPTSYEDGLAVAAALDLPAVLDMLERWLRANDIYQRAAGATATGALLRAEPSAATVLVRSIVEDSLKLPGSEQDYLGHPRGPLLEALQAATVAQPHDIVERLLEIGAGASDDLRAAFLHVFYAAAYHADKADEVARETARGCLAVADGRWGERVAVSAAESLAGLARRAPDTLL